MKEIPFLLAASLLLACESAPVTETTKVTDTIAVMEEGAVDSMAEPAPAAQSNLSLHNGVKWKADAQTLANVSLLKTVVADALKQTSVNYKLAAAGLQNGLDKMVSECSMKGADHEALHQWLLPLVQKVNAFKKASGENAAVVLREIEKQISLFDQYFA